MREGKQTAILVMSWAVVLTLALYRIVLKELFQVSLSEEVRYAIALAILLAALALAFAWQEIRPLRAFLGVFVVLMAAQWFVFTRLDRLPAIDGLLNGPSFGVALMTEKTLNLIVTLVIIAVLFLLKRDRRAFFLARGDVRASVEPVRWLGMKVPEPWTQFGRNLAIILTLGTLTFLALAARPSLEALAAAGPFLPLAIAAAALNAFNEEMSYKAPFLALLEDVVGKGRALWLMAAYFGILHFYGIPYGVIGVLMAGFLGWLLGKSMLETRGLFWAWFLHFLQDVPIFAMMAVGAIRSGG